jgi:hypothetical protein
MLLAKLKLATAVLLLMSVVGAGSRAAADHDDVQKVLDKYRAARPEPKDLAIFRLDWAPTLKDARARAAREQRPILLMVVTNSFGNVHSGHC